MSIEIVTGYHGAEHVEAAQVGRLMAALSGSGEYVLDIGGRLAASIQTANKVRIQPGEILMQGRHITSEAYTDLPIDSGSNGYKRNDVVVCRYERDSATGVETASLRVIKGTPTTGTASDPAHVDGDIVANALVAEMPLWRIPIVNLAPGTPVKLFSILPKMNASHTHPASDITGTIPVKNGGTGAASASVARENLGAPPKSHASTTKEYGAGTESDYGHVKLTDDFSPSSDAAITPQGVNDAIAQMLSITNPGGAKIFSGTLGRKDVDVFGNVELWTSAEFQEQFGVSPQDAFIAVANRNSGESGFWLASPRFNGEKVWTTVCKAIEDGHVVISPRDEEASFLDVPVAYLVIKY